MYGVFYQEITNRCHVAVLYFLLILDKFRTHSVSIIRRWNKVLWRDICWLFLDKLIHDARNIEHKMYGVVLVWITIGDVNEQIQRDDVTQVYVGELLPYYQASCLRRRYYSRIFQIAVKHAVITVLIIALQVEQQRRLCLQRWQTSQVYRMRICCVEW
jgi:hypothetical protein